MSHLLLDPDCSGYRNLEYCLVDTKLSGYKRNLRPIRNASHSLAVGVWVELNNLDNIVSDVIFRST